MTESKLRPPDGAQVNHSLLKNYARVSLMLLMAIWPAQYVWADHVPPGLKFSCKKVPQGAIIDVRDWEYFPAVDDNHKVLPHPETGKPYKGKIGFKLNDGFRFKKELRECIKTYTAIRRIDFTSDGGSVPAAFEIVQTIAEYGFHTHVPAGSQCVSACTLAFLGGARRTVDPQGTYEVHSFSSKRSLVPNLRDAIFEILDNAIKKTESLEKAFEKFYLDLDPKLTAEITEIERVSALLARQWMQTVQDRRVSARLLDNVFATTILGVRPLTRAELKDLSVITDEKPVTD